MGKIGTRQRDLSWKQWKPCEGFKQVSKYFAVIDSSCSSAGNKLERANKAAQRPVNNRKTNAVIQTKDANGMICWEDIMRR